MSYKFEISEINNKFKVTTDLCYDDREIYIGDTILIYNEKEQLYCNTFFTGTYTNGFRELIIFFFCLSPYNKKYNYILKSEMKIVEPFVRCLITEKTYL